ncbi:hypothetical protein JL720_16506 [Aureococcus anophagefferens]|nr:hypothetical protein JL720_16506 [Aureococcus anophagefferens]
MATDLTLEFKRICASMPQPEARAASPPPARTPPYQTSDHLSRALGALRAAKRAHLDPHRSPRPPLCFAHCADRGRFVGARGAVSDFKAVMRERSDAVKKQAERRELFGKRRDDEAQRPQRQRVPAFDAGAALPRPTARCRPAAASPASARRSSSSSS